MVGKGVKSVQQGYFANGQLLARKIGRFIGRKFLDSLHIETEPTQKSFMNLLNYHLLVFVRKITLETVDTLELKSCQTRNYLQCLESVEEPFLILSTKVIAFCRNKKAGIPILSKFENDFICLLWHEY